MRKILNLRNFFILLAALIVAVFLSYCIGCCYAYLYPMTYRDKIESLSEKYGVDGAIIAAVANVESGFREDVVSNKGAVGIMQLMPSTAKWLATKTGVEYSDNLLKDGNFNLELGAFYLSFLIEEFEDEKVGICAYNAGQGNVAAWLANEKYSNDGKTLSFIPFEETRNYLGKVLNNYSYYKNKYK